MLENFIDKHIKNLKPIDPTSLRVDLSGPAIDERESKVYEGTNVNGSPIVLILFSQKPGNREDDLLPERLLRYKLITNEAAMKQTGGVVTIAREPFRVRITPITEVGFLKSPIFEKKEYPPVVRKYGTICPFEPGIHVEAIYGAKNIKPLESANQPEHFLNWFKGQSSAVLESFKELTRLINRDVRYPDHVYIAPCNVKPIIEEGKPTLVVTDLCGWLWDSIESIRQRNKQGHI